MANHIFKAQVLEIEVCDVIPKSKYSLKVTCTTCVLTTYVSN